MATAKVQCSICEKEANLYLCRDCSKDFCFDHLAEHHQKVNELREKIQNLDNQFRQTLNDQKSHLERQPLIQKIDQWEKDSIRKIQQIAEECRTTVLNYANKIIHRIEMTLGDPNERPIPSGGKNKCDEIDSDQLSRKLEKLQEDLNNLERNISIEQQSTSFIKKMVVKIRMDKDTTWKEHGTAIAGGRGVGNRVHQLSSPYAISFDDDQTIYIADRNNHRIVQWKYNAREGQVVVGGDEQENGSHRLNHPADVLVEHETNSLIIADYDNKRVVRWSPQNPTDVEMITSDTCCSGLAIDRNGSVYVSDWKKHEVRRWRRGENGEGTIVAGGNRSGTQLDQLKCPSFLFVDDDHSLYVTDFYNQRVMKWAKDADTGIVVAGGNGEGNSLGQFSGPQGVIVDPFGQIYVADSGNNRVMRWCKGANEGTTVIGGNGEGKQADQLHSPMGLAFDRLGNLYVTDSENHRIQKFEVQ